MIVIMLLRVNCITNGNCWFIMELLIRWINVINYLLIMKLLFFSWLFVYFVSHVYFSIIYMYLV